ncbi:hypothetical protein HZB00_01005 [Candidatus Woesearchaeota archaeon]|nr:hypothetical protein [Candidatus Woesearchaeota archaeon]
MARIVVGLCSVGLGHAIRTKVLLDHLSKKHELLILASHRSYHYLKQYFSTVENIEGFELAFQENKVLTWKTLLKNLRKLNNQTYNRLVRVQKIVELFKPELVISDWESLSSIIAHKHTLPLISVDNQHYLLYGDYHFPFSRSLQYWKAKWVMKGLMRRAAHYVIMLLPGNILKKKKFISGAPPLLRPELFSLKPRKEDYILVYQSIKTYEKLLEILKQIPAQFIVYGFDRDQQEGNLTFKRFDDGGKFLQDLAGAKAVITTGGFTLISEALYLQKPLLIVPIQKHFEQFLNAFYVQKNKYGDYSEDLTPNAVKNFLSNLPEYVRFPKRWTNQQFFHTIDKIIEERTRH